jgi:hypothetical protein
LMHLEKRQMPSLRREAKRGGVAVRLCVIYEYMAKMNHFLCSNPFLVTGAL